MQALRAEECLRRGAFSEAVERASEALRQSSPAARARLFALRSAALRGAGHADAARRDGARAAAGSGAEAPPAPGDCTQAQPDALFAAADAAAAASTLPGASPAVCCADAGAQGRGLFVTGRVPCGAALLCELPFACVVHKAARSSRCHQCLHRLPPDALPCCSCSVARYCSKACCDRAAQGPHGRLECGGAAWPAALPTEAVLSARVAWTLSRGGDPAAAVSLLIAHWAGVPESERAERCALAAVLSACTRLAPAELLAAALTLRSNCFAVTDEWATECWSGGEREQLRAGAALYCTASMVNHSCAPNAHVSFAQGGALVLRASRDLGPAREQLLIAYGPQQGQQPCTRRRKMLRASHGFQCACEACVSPDAARRDVELCGLRCLADESCDGATHMPAEAHDDFVAPCTRCGVAAPMGVVRAAVSRAHAARAALEGARERRDVSSLRSVLAELRAVAHAHNRHTSEAWDALAQALNERGGSQGAAAEAYEACSHSLRILRVHYPPRSLPLAHELAKVALLASACGEAEAARAAAAEATAVFVANYGESYPRLRELQSLLE